MKKYIFSILFIMSTHIIIGQTTVSGNQSGVWTAAGSPYQVTGNITIPSGQTLTVEAGVSVIFQGYYRLYVNGKIIANGTESEPILFTAADHNTGWGGIRLDGTPDVSSFHYCKFEYGKTSATGGYPDMHGGAFVLKDADAEFYHCRFENNDATGDDNGMGGAVYCMNTGSATQTITRFEYCVFINNHTYGEGGAIKFTNDGMTQIIRCQFINNNAGYGGGAVFYYTAYNAQIIQSLFYNNSADNSGGGAIKTLNPQTDLHLTNCTFAYNYAYGAGEGGALNLDYADLIAVNSIFYGNQQTYGDEIKVGMNATAQIDYCDVEMPANATGSHNLNNVDPLFVNGTQGDFHLQSNSPCIDAGTDVGLPFYGTAPDLGCYEYETTGMLPLSLSGIKTFPNPVKDYLHFKPALKTGLVRIIDLQGKIIDEQKINHSLSRLDMSDMPAGYYILMYKKDNSIYRQKILKLKP